MSRYFRYRSLADLHADIVKLGLEDDVRLTDDLSPLWRPVAFGGRTIGNALAIQPMEGCDGTLDGKPDELTVRRWERFGAGGAKLIWGEATAVVEEGRANTRQLLINETNARALDDLLARTRAAHRTVCGSDDDLVVGLQLTHSGRYSYQRPLIAFHDPAVDPITLADKKRKLPVTDEYPILSDDDLKRIEDALVAGALLAWRIGFDFVDIKQCHRYLLSELLAAKLREGVYGGSLDNRTRLVRNVIRRIREETGDRLPLASRMNVYDGIPYRIDPETSVGVHRLYPIPYRSGFGVDEQNPFREDLTEPIRVAGLLREWGVTMVNVTMGSPYYNPHVGRPAEKPPIDGYEAPEHPLYGVARHFRCAAAVQRAHPDLVVVGTGYSWLQQYLINAAAANMRDGRVTIAGVGRGALAYPNFARDAQTAGSMAGKKVCITVSYCTALMRGKHNELGQFPSGCVPRDKVYAEVYKEMLRTSDRQKSVTSDK
ncbi:MAG: NADH:flavin oxidoreductase [Candidatus Latescibacteria bacterium]|nr:NADH:flavin oxidoreductase [Candidatus Latescibacterota bacterium]